MFEIVESQDLGAAFDQGTGWISEIDEVIVPGPVTAGSPGERLPPSVEPVGHRSESIQVGEGPGMVVKVVGWSALYCNAVVLCLAVPPARHRPEAVRETEAEALGQEALDRTHLSELEGDVFKSGGADPFRRRRRSSYLFHSGEKLEQVPSGGPDEFGRTDRGFTGYRSEPFTASCPYPPQDRFEGLLIRVFDCKLLVTAFGGLHQNQLVMALIASQEGPSTSALSLIETEYIAVEVHRPVEILDPEGNVPNSSDTNFPLERVAPHGLTVYTY